MNFTLRFVFAATFLSLMFDGTAAHAQQSRRHRRGGQNNYAISQQILARFLANERRNMAMLNNGRAPIYRQIPNASPSPNYTQLPDPATAGLKASFYGTMALNQLTTGKFRQGAVSGAKSLYNAHNAAAGYQRSLASSLRAYRIPHIETARHSFRRGFGVRRECEEAKKLRRVES